MMSGFFKGEYMKKLIAILGCVFLLAGCGHSTFVKVERASNEDDVIKKNGVPDKYMEKDEGKTKLMQYHKSSSLYDSWNGIYYTGYCDFFYEIDATTKQVTSINAKGEACDTNENIKKNQNADGTYYIDKNQQFKEIN